MARLTPLHRNGHARSLDRLDHRFLQRGRDGVVGLAQQVGGRDVAPGGVGHGAGERGEGVVSQFAGPVLGRGSGQVVVEVVRRAQRGDAVALGVPNRK